MIERLFRAAELPPRLREALPAAKGVARLPPETRERRQGAVQGGGQSQTPNP